MGKVGRGFVLSPPTNSWHLEEGGVLQDTSGESFPDEVFKKIIDLID